MGIVSIKALLEAGVHFGHQTRRWNPKMRRFIFTKRNGIHIIDLQKTSKFIDTAYNFVKDIAENGGKILFVGTKKQAADSVREEAERSGSYYVNSRWLGGTLTNFATIRKRVGRLSQLKNMRDDGTFELLPKKEVLKLNAEIEKLERFLGGIVDMVELPDALFVVDTKKEYIAVLEARKLGIPVVAVLDTNCDPDLIDVKIPGNDDAIRSIKLLCTTIANAVIEGNEGNIAKETSEENSFDDNQENESLSSSAEVFSSKIGEKNDVVEKNINDDSPTVTDVSE